MTLRYAPGRTVLLGTTLVLLLVALQPLALGLFPVCGSTDGESSESAGIGTGTGDLTAGALSALVRDMNTDGGVPTHARSVSPVVLVPLAELETQSLRHLDARRILPVAPATTLAGSSAHGYQLLL